MNTIVTLSNHTKKLIGQSCSFVSDSCLHEWNQQSNNHVNQASVVAWLARKTEDSPESKFLLEALRASLLHDLYESFSQPEEEEHHTRPRPGWFAKLQFLFLAIAGTIVAICQGFDGIASLLRLSSAMPTAVILLAGFAFSILSVGVFYGFDLVEISRNVGVKFGKSSQLLDILVEQVEHINKIRKAIDDSFTEITNIHELQTLMMMLDMLTIRFNELDQARAIYNAALNNTSLKIAKLTSAAMSGILFFGGGFFAGQSLISSIIGLFTTSVTATCWPVLIASVGVGLAALSIYWFVERPGLENLVGRWMGLDKITIDALAHDEIVTTQKSELQKLTRKVAQQITVRQEILSLKQQIADLTMSHSRFTHMHLSSSSSLPSNSLDELPHFFQSANLRTRKDTSAVSSSAMREFPLEMTNRVCSTTLT